jgi:CheY-like chemotaxis protein
LDPLRIMIVDDDAELVAELAEALASEGYDVRSYTDSYEASQDVHDINPHLVLLDLRMDKKSGFKLANEISHRPETSHIPVIAMTGYYQSGTHNGLMQLVGIRRCLTKPLDPVKLMSVIDEMLRDTE